MSLTRSGFAQFLTEQVDETAMGLLCEETIVDLDIDPSDLEVIESNHEDLIDTLDVTEPAEALEEANRLFCQILINFRKYPDDAAKCDKRAELLRSLRNEIFTKQEQWQKTITICNHIIEEYESLLPIHDVKNFDKTEHDALDIDHYWTVIESYTHKAGALGMLEQRDAALQACRKAMDYLEVLLKFSNDATFVAHSVLLKNQLTQLLAEKDKEDKASIEAKKPQGSATLKEPSSKPTLPLLCFADEYINQLFDKFDRIHSKEFKDLSRYEKAAKDALDDIQLVLLKDICLNQVDKQLEFRMRYCKYRSRLKQWRELDDLCDRIILAEAAHLQKTHPEKGREHIQAAYRHKIQALVEIIKQKAIAKKAAGPLEKSQIEKEILSCTNELNNSRKVLPELEKIHNKMCAAAASSADFKLNSEFEISDIADGEFALILRNIHEEFNEIKPLYKHNYIAEAFDKINETKQEVASKPPSDSYIEAANSFTHAIIAEAKTYLETKEFINSATSQLFFDRALVRLQLKDIKGALGDFNSAIWLCGSQIKNLQDSDQTFRKQELVLNLARYYWVRSLVHLNCKDHESSEKDKNHLFKLLESFNSKSGLGSKKASHTHDEAIKNLRTNNISAAILISHSVFFPEFFTHFSADNFKKLFSMFDFVYSAIKQGKNETPLDLPSTSKKKKKKNPADKKTETTEQKATPADKDVVRQAAELIHQEAQKTAEAAKQKAERERKAAEKAELKQENARKHQAAIEAAKLEAEKKREEKKAAELAKRQAEEQRKQAEKQAELEKTRKAQQEREAKKQEELKKAQEKAREEKEKSDKEAAERKKMLENKKLARKARKSANAKQETQNKLTAINISRDLVSKALDRAFSASIVHLAEEAALADQLSQEIEDQNTALEQLFDEAIHETIEEITQAVIAAEVQTPPGHFRLVERPLADSKSFPSFSSFAESPYSSISAASIRSDQTSDSSIFPSTPSSIISRLSAASPRSDIFSLSESPVSSSPVPETKETKQDFSHHLLSKKENIGDLKTKIEISKTAKDTLEKLKSSGVSAFLVGGLVRDAELGSKSYKPKRYLNSAGTLVITNEIDIDIVTETLSKEQLEKIFPPNEGYKVLPSKVKKPSDKTDRSKEKDRVESYNISLPRTQKGIQESMQISCSRYLTEPHKYEDGLYADALSRDFYHNALYSDEEGNVYAPLPKSIDVLNQKPCPIEAIDRRELYKLEGKTYDTSQSSEYFFFAEDPKRLLRALVSAATSQEFQYSDDFAKSIPEGLRLFANALHCDRQMAGMINYFLQDKLFYRLNAFETFNYFTHMGLTKILFPNLHRIAPKQLEQILKNELDIRTVYASFLLFENINLFKREIISFYSDDAFKQIFAQLADNNPLYHACFEGKQVADIKNILFALQQKHGLIHQKEDGLWYLTHPQQVSTHFQSEYKSSNPLLRHSQFRAPKTAMPELLPSTHNAHMVKQGPARTKTFLQDTTTEFKPVIKKP